MHQDFTVTEKNGIQFISIQNDNCKAEVCLFGGHVTEWQPEGHAPVLWMSEASALDGSAAIRGGIPVCWPWFGPADNKGRHGLVRTMNWTLEDAKEEPDLTVLKLSCDIGKDKALAWSHPQIIEQTLIFGSRLTQTCKVVNPFNTPVNFAYALHNYFQIGSLNHLSVPELTGRPYYCKINNLDNQCDSSEPDYNGPIDRVYQSDGPASITDSIMQRRISISKHGSANWVLWNPGTMAADISDIHKDGEKSYLCLEAASTSDIEVAANSSMEFGQTIAVTALD